MQWTGVNNLHCVELVTQLMKPENMDAVGITFALMIQIIGISKLMIQTLQSIQRKIDDIGLGLLRVRENKLQASIQIRAKCDEKNLIQCYAIEKKDIGQFSNRKVSLVQKWDDDYLYISGQTGHIPGNSESLPVRIFRACWFVRKRTGRITWFQEKHIYHLIPD